MGHSYSVSNKCSGICDDKYIVFGTCRPHVHSLPPVQRVAQDPHSIPLNKPDFNNILQHLNASRLRMITVSNISAFPLIVESMNEDCCEVSKRLLSELLDPVVRTVGVLN
jgi:hypothetical protein